MNMNSLFSSKSRKNKKETLIKESLLSQLSNSVKEVQLLSSQRHEIFSTDEATNTLIVVLESIFLHGIKRGIFQAAITTVGGIEERKPQPSFWLMVSNYTHNDTIGEIKELSQVSTDVGRSRAWIRIALNQTELTSYLQAMLKDRRPVSSAYYNYAFLRDRDTFDTALQLLEGINAVQFEIPINSSLLNSWGNEPLMLSGIWSPSLRSTPIHAGIDVAEGIYDDDSVSLRTTTSMSSLSAVLALDENQALKLILETPIRSLENSSPIDIPPVITEKYGTDELNVDNYRPTPTPPSTSKILETNEKGQDNDDVIQESKQIGNSLTKQTWSSDEVEESNDTKTYSNLLESYGTPSQGVNYKHILNNMETRDIEENSDDADFEVVGKTKGNLQNLNELEDCLLKIPTEIGLMNQKYTCAGCQLSIGLDFAQARLCHYTKKYYCRDCHINQTSVIPSRIMFNWDLKEYPVSCQAYDYLQEIVIDIKAVNPKLYQAVEEMKEINIIRLQLNLLRAYLYTCKEPLIIELQKRIWPREYLYEQIHTYTISDLKKIEGGVLASQLTPVIKFAREHVTNCWLCSQKGFVCEICKNPKVIYPFDSNSTYRCNKCYSVYHGECLAKIKRNCPKCQRRQKRLNE